MSMFIGEALAGDGNEIAHIDLLIGDKDGPVGTRLCQRPGPAERGALEPAGRAHAQPGGQAGHRAGHQGHDQGREAGRADVRPRPGRRGQGRGRLRGGRASSPRIKAEDLVIVCGVFIHLAADGRQEDLRLQLRGHQEAIASAMDGKPTADEMIAGKDKAAHPFRGF